MNFLSIVALILTVMLSVFVCVQFLTKEKHTKKQDTKSQEKNFSNPRIPSDNYDRYLVKKYIIPKAAQDNKIVEFHHEKYGQ